MTKGGGHTSPEHGSFIKAAGCLHRALRQAHPSHTHSCHRCSGSARGLGAATAPQGPAPGLGQTGASCARRGPHQAAFMVQKPLLHGLTPEGVVAQGTAAADHSVARDEDGDLEDRGGPVSLGCRPGRTGLLGSDLRLPLGPHVRPRSQHHSAVSGVSTGAGEGVGCNPRGERVAPSSQSPCTKLREGRLNFIWEEIPKVHLQNSKSQGGAWSSQTFLRRNTELTAGRCL